LNKKDADETNILSPASIYLEEKLDDKTKHGNSITNLENDFNDKKFKKWRNPSRKLSYL